MVRGLLYMGTLMAAEAVLGTASLWNSLDKKLLCELRDGQVLIGYLRSIDQFGPFPSQPGPGFARRRGGLS